MDDIDAVLSHKEITFEEAIKYFGERVPVTSEEFYKIYDKYKNLVFTVSGYTKAEILNKFYEEIKSAIEDGTTLKQFQDNMNSFLESEGYEGMEPLQADNIYRTNIQTAYNVGHYEQMTQPEVLKARPYWQYDAVNDSHTRKSHLAMDGKVFPANSPIWDIWYPPNGFRCRCSVRPLSKRQLDQMGAKVEMDLPKFSRMKNGHYVYIYPDPKFSTNAAKVRFEPDMKGYPEPLIKAYQNRKNENA